MPQSPRTPSLRGQVLTCLLFVALASIITIAAHPAPVFSEWQAGEPLGVQFAVASLVAVALFAGAVIALQLPRVRRLVRPPEALNAIDLSGGRPWIVGICAGVGEELLFRAALQPLAGLGFGALIFAAAHARTAILGSTSNVKRAAYVMNVFMAGVALGLLFEHVGLLAAVLIHAAIDVAGLWVFRTLLKQRTPGAA